MSRQDSNLASVTALNSFISAHPINGCKLAREVLGKHDVNCLLECPFRECVSNYQRMTQLPKNIYARNLDL